MNTTKAIWIGGAVLTGGLAWWLWKSHPHVAGFLLAATLTDIGYAVGAIAPPAA